MITRGMKTFSGSVLAWIILLFIDGVIQDVHAFENATSSLGQKSSDFTCVVLQFPGNGCGESDFALVGDMMAKLFYKELDLKDVLFVDNMCHKEKVFSMSTEVTSNKLSSAGNTRRRLTNICKVTGYCQRSPDVCAAYGCPGYRRRRFLQEQEDSTSGTFYNLAALSFKGASMLRRLSTINPDCRPKELGFLCEDVSMAL